MGNSGNVCHVPQLIPHRWPHHLQLWSPGTLWIISSSFFWKMSEENLFPLKAMSIAIFPCLLTYKLKALNLGEVWPSSNLSSCLLWRILCIHRISLLAHPQTWNSKVHVPMLHLYLLGLNRFIASSWFDDVEYGNFHCPWKHLSQLWQKSSPIQWNDPLFLKLLVWQDNLFFDESCLVDG